MAKPKVTEAFFMSAPNAAPSNAACHKGAKSNAPARSVETQISLLRKYFEKSSAGVADDILATAIQRYGVLNDATFNEDIFEVETADGYGETEQVEAFCETMRHDVETCIRDQLAAASKAEEANAKYAPTPVHDLIPLARLQPVPDAPGRYADPVTGENYDVKPSPPTLKDGRAYVNVTCMKPDGTPHRTKMPRARVNLAAKLGRWPVEADHINGKRGDDRFSNLREATRQENEHFKHTLKLG